MYRKILVPLDGSTTSQRALTEAAQLAQLCGASLVLLHIVDDAAHVNGFERPAVYVQEIRPRFLAAGQALLDTAKAGLVATPVAVETVLVECCGDRVSERIVEHAVKSGADLIVLGTHGRRGVDRLLIGSDAEQVARLAPVPVLLVRALQPM